MWNNKKYCATLTLNSVNFPNKSSYFRTYTEMFAHNPYSNTSETRSETSLHDSVRGLSENRKRFVQNGECKQIR